MKLNGAQVVWESLVREGVEVIFGISGGSVINLFHELTDYPIRYVLTRHEQGGAHAADGYARATGKAGVCIATSGPGATNLVTGLATAHMDSTPVVAITGQVPKPVIGTDAFQEVDITGISLPITKHNFLVTEAEELPGVIKEAFHIAQTGRPGPVLIDIAKSAQQEVIKYRYPEQVHLPGYKPNIVGHKGKIKQAARLINEAERPLLIGGHGVIISRAEDELLECANKADIPVINTLLGLGSIPQNHPLCLGMAGMHGEAYANHAIQNCDVFISVGCRFDDRLTGILSNFAPNAKIIHIDIDTAEIGKLVSVDIPIVGDAKNILENLLPLIEERKHPDWWAQIDEWKEESVCRDVLGQEIPCEQNPLPQYIFDRIWKVTQGDAIMVSDVGQNQMWEAQYFNHINRRSLLSSGGLGTMGFALPAAIGAQVGCPNKTVWATAGDGGFQMNIQELATVIQERLPVKIAILNNGFLGMVRQWQEIFFNKNYSGTVLAYNPDFVKVAEAYGIKGLRASQQQEIDAVIDEAMETDGPVVIDFRIVQEENVYPMVAPGKAVDEMIRRPEQLNGKYQPDAPYQRYNGKGVE